MKEFKLPRKISKLLKSDLTHQYGEEGKRIADSLQGALPAICLSSHSAFFTAYINDALAEMVYAQQVYGYGKKGDVLMAITTSGDSKNILNAVIVAKAMGLKIIGLTGDTGGKLKGLCDVCIKAPANETYRIQELHVPIYHALCEMLENEFFGMYMDN